MKSILGMIAMVLALGGSWTAAEEIGPVSAPLGPMAKPELRVGDTALWRTKKGEEWTRTVVEVDAKSATFEESDGCTFTRQHEVFAETEEWSNCGSDGSGTFSLTKGEIWPLKAGKKWWHKFVGKTVKGKKWKYKKVCTVKEEVRVSVPAGEFDTYHVVCNTGNNIKKHYYVSPDIGKNVMYKRIDKYGRQAPRSRVLVSFEQME